MVDLKYFRNNKLLLFNTSRTSVLIVHIHFIIPDHHHIIFNVNTLFGLAIVVGAVSVNLELQCSVGEVTVADQQMLATLKTRRA